ncbi:hypothetical protein L0666_06365 [Octadecabacter sp. CECT 8868]|uniref:calcium-binding protein n=1 Tax=Octadecabacter algicola TaxID=2909342 RepID=UPI001F3ADE07|nr:calcium-binding protein [Octadecabacter algicola]MCF2904604.1 hypothetical protein [Octadecabacter algicola]
MTFTVVSSDIIGTANGVTLTTDDEILILEGVHVISTTGDGIYGSTSADNVDITVAGTVVGDNRGIMAFGDDITLTILETGSVIGTLEDAGTGALNFEGENASVTNYGTILGSDMFGIFFGDPSATLNNSGQISGTSGVLLWDTDATIVNSGTIMGSANDRTDEFVDHGVVVRGGASVITNLDGGIIGTSSQDGSGVVIMSNLFGSEFTLNNFGQIVGDAYGFVNNSNSTILVSDINNHGTISGNVAGMQGGAGIEDVANSGLIGGDVNLGNGDDKLLNFGLIDGDVDLGGDDDIYRAIGDGAVAGSIVGGSGDDTLTGASGEDEFFGDAGDDILRGADGDDVLFGGSDDDVLDGGVGDDVLYGEDDDDRLLGKAGEDVLFGGDGDDILRGDAGLDVLYGGAGSDRLFGGSGEDQFLFTSITDSPNTNTDRDIIRDFEVGVDLIGVSQLSSPAFAFIGSAGFSGTAPELRAVVSAGGDTNVYLDTDGSGVADMRILVSGVTTLTADDFIL